MTSFRARLCRDAAGFTLVEVLAAITMFALVTVGMIPLLASALKGTNLTRSYTIGKTHAQRALERIRGLPYHISYASQGEKVDVLDLYYPSYTASGEFVTTCTSASTDPACPRSLPDGYTLEFTASFVKPVLEDADGDGVDEETFHIEVPPSNYVWNPSTSSTTDQPPTTLLRVSILASWRLGARTPEFELKGIVGDRRFERLKIAGAAQIDYGIQVLTFFENENNVKTALTAIDGDAESRIESKLLSTADQRVAAGGLTITTVPPDSSTVAETVDAAEGARTSLHALPNQAPGPVSEVADIVVNSTLTPAFNAAGIDATTADELQVTATSELPFAKGSYRYAASTATEDLWVNQQLDTVNAAVLHLDVLRNMFSVRPKVDSGDAIYGTTFGESTSVTSGDRYVRTGASFSTGDVKLLPTTFINPDLVDVTVDHSVVVVDSFSALVTCDSTANDTTASATVEWDATVRYWKDGTQDGILNGGYQTLTLDETNAATALANLLTENPLVYDGLSDLDDIYLFEVGSKKGYLKAWTAGTPVTAKLESGDVTQASIEGAMRIDTVDLNPSVQGSTINLSLAKMTCDAADRR